MRAAVLITLVCLLWPALGIAQAPTFDPLRRMEDQEEAQVSWDASLAYYPRGSTGVGCDESGQYFTFVRFSGQCQSDISLSWTFNRCHKLGMTLSQATTTIFERRWYAAGEWEQSSSTRTFTYSGYYEYRIDPDSQFDPRIRLSSQYPHALGLAASASCVLDPVVLAGMIGIVHKHDRPHRWIDASLSAGLVANSRVTLTASGGLIAPVNDAGLPSASAGFCARYALVPNGELELAVRTSLHVQGESTWTGITVSIRGRDA